MFEAAARDHRTQRRMFELKFKHLACMELNMYHALLGAMTYDTLAHMDTHCCAELQSADSDISECDVVPVPTELIEARLRIVEWQHCIHTTQAHLSPAASSTALLLSAGDATVDRRQCRHGHQPQHLH